MADYQHRPATRRRKSKKRRRQQRRAALFLAVFVLCIVGGILLIRWGADLRAQINERKRLDAQQQSYEEDILARVTIYPGVTINGVDVGGLTEREAIEKVNRQIGLDGMKITLKCNDRIVEVGADKLQPFVNTEEVVREALQAGRSGERADRIAQVERLSQSGLQLFTKLTTNDQAVYNAIPELVSALSFDPEPAVLTGVDLSGDGIHYIIQEAKPGQSVDGEKLRQILQEQLESQTFGIVGVPCTQTASEMTGSAIREKMTLISSFTTHLTNNSARNENVRLCSSTLSGTVVQPGAIFSVNETTGERTEAKGYKPAGTIVDGILVDEPGGGVCQVSGTLYNAVLRSDLEIVERAHHTWPSDYVPYALDAMINYPTQDFRFRNNTEYPIVVIASMNLPELKLTMKIYGRALPDGEKLDFYSEILETVAKPGYEYKLNAALLPDETKEIKKSRPGYKVKVVRKIFDKDGNLIREADLYENYYRPIAGIMEVGSEALIPTPTPSGLPMPTFGFDPSETDDEAQNVPILPIG